MLVKGAGNVGQGASNVGQGVGNVGLGAVMLVRGR